MERLFENRRQERIVKFLKMIKGGKIVNRNTIGDFGVGDTAISCNFESIMYDLRLPIKYDGKLHSCVATEDFEIPWRVVNDEIGEILQDSKDKLHSILSKDNSNQHLQHLPDNISKI